MEKIDKAEPGGKDMTIEEAFSRLEQVVRDLEDRSITLEDSFARYKEGMNLIQACNNQIELVEQKIQVLNQEGGLEELS